MFVGEDQLPDGICRDRVKDTSKRPHMNSPGVKHSSKAKVSTQKLKEVVSHSGPRSFQDKSYQTCWFVGIIAGEERFVKGGSKNK